MISSADCLKLWEAGAGLHPLDRGLLILDAAEPESSLEALADWPLGRRNQALARVHCASFGRYLQGWTACRRCGEKLEVQVDGRLLAEGEAPPDPAAPEPIVVNGHKFRRVTTRDLAAVARETEVRQATLRLVHRCQLEPAETPAWNDAELEQIGQRLALADPLAETQLALRCPACEQEWEETLDIVAFLWREIEARARRLVREIHWLAATYGWAEADILAMSAVRRALYLEMMEA